jgi:hypothetical protein
VTENQFIRFKASHFPNMCLGAVEANRFSGFSILALIAIMIHVSALPLYRGLKNSGRLRRVNW